LRVQKEAKQWDLQCDSEYESELTESDFELKLLAANEWAAKVLDESMSRERRNRNRRSPIQKELEMYREVVHTKRFTAAEARKFWLESWNPKHYHVYVLLIDYL